MSHYVGGRNCARNFLLRYHHQRMMEHSIQQQAHDYHRLVFPKFVHQEALLSAKYAEVEYSINPNLLAETIIILFGSSLMFSVSLKYKNKTNILYCT